MQYKFYAHSHPNILGTHKTTLEFTKDKNLSLEGDCIIGVNSDFELKKIKNFIKNAQYEKHKIVKIKISSLNGEFRDEVTAELNPSFNNAHEIVVRKTDFVSERTLATNANKSSSELDRRLIDYLKVPNRKVIVEFSCN